MQSSPWWQKYAGEHYSAAVAVQAQSGVGTEQCWHSAVLALGSVGTRQCWHSAVLALGSVGTVTHLVRVGMPVPLTTDLGASSAYTNTLALTHTPMHERTNPHIYTYMWDVFANTHKCMNANAEMYVCVPVCGYFDGVMNDQDGRSTS